MGNGYGVWIGVATFAVGLILAGITLYRITRKEQEVDNDG